MNGNITLNLNLNTYDSKNYDLCKLYIELYEYIQNEQTICEAIDLSRYENPEHEINMSNSNCRHISIAKAYLKKYKSERGAREINLSRYDFNDYKYCKSYRKRHHTLHVWENDYNVFDSNLRGNQYNQTNFYIILNEFTWPDMLIAGEYLRKYEIRYKRDKQRIRDNTNHGRIFTELGSRPDSNFSLKSRNRERSRSRSLGGSRTRRRTISSPFLKKMFTARLRLHRGSSKARKARTTRRK